MKALLIKDYCILIREVKQMLLVPVVFTVMAVVTKQLVWILWPVFFISLLPYTINSYEEQSNWPLYAETMPYGRKRIVYEKYAMMLINGMIMTLILSAVTASILLLKGSFDFAAMWQMIVLIIAGAILPGCLMLPMMFKYGNAKGRVMYLIVLAMFGGLMGAMGTASKDAKFYELLQYGHNMNFTGLLLGVLIVFFLSVRLSVHFYEKRDI